MSASRGLDNKVVLTVAILLCVYVVRVNPLESKPRTRSFRLQVI